VSIEGIFRFLENLCSCLLRAFEVSVDILDIDIKNSVSSGPAVWDFCISDPVVPS